MSHELTLGIWLNPSWLALVIRDHYKCNIEFPFVPESPMVAREFYREIKSEKIFL